MTSPRRSKVAASIEEAISDVHDGASIMFGGFAFAGSPTNLIRALVARGTANLTVIGMSIGIGDDLDLLCQKKQIARMVSSYAIRASAAQPTLFEQLYTNGEVELDLVPQGTLAERIRAGGAGIAAFYTPTGAGTPVAEGKDTRSFDGRNYVMERALTADFAFIRASAADELGNLVYHAASRNFNAIMAKAARTTIVEVDEVVKAGELDPEAIVTPGIYVDRIVKVPQVEAVWITKTRERRAARERS